MAEGDRRGALRQRQGTGGRTWHRLLLIGEKNRQIEHKAVGWPFHISVFPKAVVSGYGNEWQICLENNQRWRFANSLPEPDFRYASKAYAFSLLSKAMAV